MGRDRGKDLHPRNWMELGPDGLSLAPSLQLHGAVLSAHLSFLTASLCPSCLPSVQDWSQAVHDGAVLCHLQTHPRVPVCTPGPVTARQVPPARGSGDGSLAKPSSLSALLDRWDLS